LKRIADFLFEAGMLKRTPRTGWQFLGSGAESVAEHIFRTGLIAHALSGMEEGVDGAKVLKMALFHDLPEARTGDLNYMNQKYVTVDEGRAAADMSAGLPFGPEMAGLFEEFRAQETAEARLVRDADNLEMLLQLKEHHDVGNRNAAEWIPFTVRRLKSDSAKKLADAILAGDSSAWWFDKSSDWWVKGGKT
jgi:putative hydrolase of HD superfamily